MKIKTKPSVKYAGGHAAAEYAGVSAAAVKEPYFVRLGRCIRANKSLYLMVVPVLLYYFLFCYKPMYGAIIAFKNFIPGRGIMDSPWVGLRNFTDFFTSIYCFRVIKNTLVISLASIVFGFPAPIILALLLNEIQNVAFKKTVQTITYMPHFVSLVVVCGMILEFTSNTGVITYFLHYFGFPLTTMMNHANYFVPVYVISDIWQGIGWGSIIYLAALTGIDPTLYEAAEIDGAGRWKQMLHVTLPGIMATVIIMLILRMGGIMSVGYEKIILLYNPATYSTADVISSYTYRKGLQDFDWSYSTAVGLFNSAINFVFLILTNWLSRKFTDSSLW